MADENAMKNDLTAICERILELGVISMEVIPAQIETHERLIRALKTPMAIDACKAKLLKLERIWFLTCITARDVNKMVEVYGLDVLNALPTSFSWGKTDYPRDLAENAARVFADLGNEVMEGLTTRMMPKKSI